MLPQTRRAVEALKEAGLTRDQFRIRTPWKQGKGSGKTTIALLCPFSQTAPHLKKLAQLFRVVVAFLDGIPCSVSIEISEETGLFKLENGQVEPIREIVVTSGYEQLAFEEFL